MNIRGVIFDKDGTLFDFQSTWGIWTAQVLARIAGSDEALLQQLAEALGYDTQTRRVQPGSVIVAATPMDIAAVVKDCIPALSQTQICDWLNEEAKTAPQVLVTDLHRLTAELRRINLGLCVMTNDAEAPARAHLASVQASDLFDFVIGSDSGFGAKPQAAPLLALADKMEIPAAACVMVGDSTHDLRAGRAAGMRAVAVLTGLAEADELAPLADAVLPDVSHLPAWISAQNS
ncbi:MULTISPECIES: HAD family hydrolase [Planktomarina]|jgi:phosphoglycolate phosphatase|uniref:HAD family hydrolase n=1 Tax=Planktomarina TaxID=1284657 RepID=UPI002705750D|nr:HAD family hydrolase [Planktomarina temperata]